MRRFSNKPIKRRPTGTFVNRKFFSPGIFFIHFNMDFVKLVSGDGFSIILDRAVAIQSSTIKSILDTTRNNDSSEGMVFAEALKNEISFPEIKGKVLDKVCQYLTYKHRYSLLSTELPAFPFDLEMSLELLMAADYLDC